MPGAAVIRARGMAAWMQVRAALPAAAVPGPAPEPVPPGPVVSVLAAMTLAAMAAR